MAAADFTNIRVESTDFHTVTIRYAYAGAAGIKLYRALSGGAFAVVIVVGTAYGSYPSPLIDADTTLKPGTLYEYKFSDDNGATFTSTVTVKTHKAFPVGKEASKTRLPEFTDEASVNAENLDELSSQVETLLTNDVLKPQQPCTVCPVNGSVILDCSEGCYKFIVKRDDMTDINSISINCEKLEVLFDVPEGTSTEIGGYPPNTGFTGDEGFNAPVSSPVNLVMNINDPDPCPNERSKVLGATPCKGDYLYECWDKNSLYRNSTKRTQSVTDCACSSVGDGITSVTDGSYTWTMISGRKPLGTLAEQGVVGSAGMSIYYKSGNTSCVGVGPRTIGEYTIGGLGASALSYAVVGKPIFGWAINVPVGATIKNFTGRVLLFDYPNSRFLWGTYTNADLHAGTMPTTLSTIAFSTITPQQIKLILDGNAGGGYTSVNVSLDNASQTETIADTGIALITEPVGFGLIWVANTSPASTHAATITIPTETAILWW